jgi:hypothetical protein
VLVREIVEFAHGDHLLADVSWDPADELEWNLDQTELERRCEAEQELSIKLHLEEVDRRKAEREAKMQAERILGAKLTDAASGCENPSCPDPDAAFAKLRRCACKNVSYCSRECQKARWKVHKRTCAARTPKTAPAPARAPAAPPTLSVSSHGLPLPWAAPHIHLSQSQIIASNAHMDWRETTMGGFTSENHPMCKPPWDNTYQPFQPANGNGWYRMHDLANTSFEDVKPVLAAMAAIVAKDPSALHQRTGMSSITGSTTRSTPLVRAPNQRSERQMCEASAAGAKWAPNKCGRSEVGAEQDTPTAKRAPDKRTSHPSLPTSPRPLPLLILDAR